MKTYSELIKLPTFEERFEYLRCNGKVGDETFGFMRWLNQVLYHSKEWHDVKREVIIRDRGCDLAVAGMEIRGNILVHHMNPICEDDILKRRKCVLDPENLISTCKQTHDAIHYGDIKLLNQNKLITRSLNDTCPWKR